MPLSRTVLLAPGAGILIDGILLAAYGWRLAARRPFVVTLTAFTRGTQVFGLILFVPVAIEAYRNSHDDPTGLLRLIASAVGAAAALFVLVAQFPLARGRGGDLIVLNVSKAQVHEAVARGLADPSLREHHGAYELEGARVDVRMGATAGAAIRVCIDGPRAPEVRSRVRASLGDAQGDRRLLGIAEAAFGAVLAIAGLAMLVIGLK